MDFWESESVWFQMYSGKFLAGELLEKETIILYLNVSLNTILSTDIYVVYVLSRNYVFRVDPITRDYSGPE